MAVPGRRPDCVIADRGYDRDKYRRRVRERGIKPVNRSSPDGARLGAGPVPLGRSAYLRLPAQALVLAEPEWVNHCREVFAGGESVDAPISRILGWRLALGGSVG